MDLHLLRCEVPLLRSDLHLLRCEGPLLQVDLAGNTTCLTYLLTLLSRAAGRRPPPLLLRKSTSDQPSNVCQFLLDGPQHPLCQLVHNC